MAQEYRLILKNVDAAGYTPDMECYLRHGGYEVLKKALSLPPKLDTAPPTVLELKLAHSPDSDDAFMFYGLATRKISTGHLRFSHVLEDIGTLNRKALDRLKQDLQLYWEEKARQACHDNIMSVYTLMKLYGAPLEEVNRLAEAKYLAGDDYTVADIAVWPWYGGLAKGLLYGSAEFLAVHEYKNVNRWADEIGARPAVKRGRIVNRLQGDPKQQLRERHDASDFELRTQDKLEAKNAAD